MCNSCIVFFFFFKQKTAYEMRISDWSSDVCSSDLAALLSSAGDPLLFRQALRSDGRLAIVNFMYTRCFSICLAMGSEFQQLQNAIVRRDLADRVRIISLSFDPADTPVELARYAERMRADSSIWTFAAIRHIAQQIGRAHV